MSHGPLPASQSAQALLPHPAKGFSGHSSCLGPTEPGVLPTCPLGMEWGGWKVDSKAETFCLFHILRFQLGFYLGGGRKKVLLLS